MPVRHDFKVVAVSLVDFTSVMADVKYARMRIKLIDLVSSVAVIIPLIHGCCRELME